MKRWIYCMMALFLIGIPVSVSAAGETPPYVYDQSDIISTSTEQEFTEYASRYAEEYEVGIYLVVLDDWTVLEGTDVLSGAKAFYTSGGYGYGEGKDGILLFLSMKERDYAIFAMGAKGNPYFSDYALTKIEESFLDDFAENDFDIGALDYLENAVVCLAMAEEGTPLNADNDPDNEMGMAAKIAIVIGVPCAIAGMVCLIFASQMKSVKKKNANAYISRGGLDVYLRNDKFTHSTVVRTKIQKASSGSSRGSSGHSGKF